MPAVRRVAGGGVLAEGDVGVVLDGQGASEGVVGLDDDEFEVEVAPLRRSALSTAGGISELNAARTSSPFAPRLTIRARFLRAGMLVTVIAFAAAVLVAINSLFQIVAFAFLGYFYLKVLPGWLGLFTVGIHLSVWRIAQTVLMFLGVPLAAGFLVWVGVLQLLLSLLPFPLK